MGYGGKILFSFDLQKTNNLFIYRLSDIKLNNFVENICCAPFRSHVFVFVILAKFGVSAFIAFLREKMSAPRNVFFILYYVLVPGGNMDDDDDASGSGDTEPEPEPEE